MTAPSTEAVEQELHDNPSDIVHLWCMVCVRRLRAGQPGTAYCGYTTSTRSDANERFSLNDRCVVCADLEHKPRRCGH